MERKILFRGKRIDNGEWVYGAFVPDALEMLNDLDGMYGFIRRYNPDARKTEMFEVDRETVGQYTGLTDKNGIKIFEGDIVRAVTPNTSKNFCVKFEYGKFCIGICMPLAYVRNSAEVIGNIHDNPDLLITDRRAN